MFQNRQTHFKNLAANEDKGLKRSMKIRSYCTVSLKWSVFRIITKGKIQ